MKIRITFPSDSSIDINKLSAISIESHGYIYTPQIQMDENDSYIIYRIKTKIRFFRNSFVPEITVKKIPDSSGETFDIVGRLRKTVRLFLYFYCALLVIVQCFLIKAFIENTLASIFPLFIPLILFVFLFSIAFVFAFVETKAFAEKFKEEVKKLIISSNL